MQETEPAPDEACTEHRPANRPRGRSTPNREPFYFPNLQSLFCSVEILCGGQFGDRPIGRATFHPEDPMAFVTGDPTGCRPGPPSRDVACSRRAESPVGLLRPVRR
jgi:hypothetical protein